LVPVLATKKSQIMADVADNVGKMTLSGILDQDSLTEFEDELQELLAAQPDKLSLLANDLESIDGVVLRALIFALHKLGPNVDVELVGANPAVQQSFANADVAVTVRQN